MTRLAQIVPLSMGRIGIVALLRKLIGLFWRAHEVRRQRLELQRLDDRLLRDIGIDRADALLEARRPFWDIVTRREG